MGQDESHSYFIFCCKTTVDYISVQINRTTLLILLSKVSPKVIIMGPLPQSHNDINLKILLPFLELFLRDLSYCRRKAFHEDCYDKTD